MPKKRVPFPPLPSDHPARTTLRSALEAWTDLRRSTGRATFTRGVVDVLAVLFALLDDPDEERARACLDKLRRTAREYVKARNPIPMTGSASDDTLYASTMLEKRVELLRFVGQMIGQSAGEERAQIRRGAPGKDLEPMDPSTCAQWIYIALTMTGWFKPPTTNPIPRMTEQLERVEYALPSVASSADTVRAILVAFGLSNREASDAIAGYGDPVCSDDPVEGLEEEFSSAAAPLARATTLPRSE